MGQLFDEDLIKFGFEGEKEVSKPILLKFGRKYKKHSIIIKEGDVKDDIYIILKGSCYVTKKIDGKYKVLNIINKGEIFGEMAVFGQTKRTATIIAKEDNTICLKFKKEDFMEIFKLHPRWVDKIINEISVRIVKMIKKLRQ